MIRLRYLLMALLATFLTASLGFAAEKMSFSAKLSGGESVPAVKSAATGKAEFKVSKDGKELTYKLTVKGIEEVTAAHIHLGKKGVSGPPLAGLYPGPKKEGKFSGVLAKGTITEKELMGDLPGKTVEDLVKLIRSGDTYVNVHSVAHPDGEIRGQIK